MSEKHVWEIQTVLQAPFFESILFWLLWNCRPVLIQNTFPKILPRCRCGFFCSNKATEIDCMPFAAVCDKLERRSAWSSTAATESTPKTKFRNFLFKARVWVHLYFSLLNYNKVAAFNPYVQQQHLTAVYNNLLLLFLNVLCCHCTFIFVL